MVAPTRKVRSIVLEREGFMCIRCGARSPLEMQHRARVGMGGSRRSPGVVEVVAACSACNQGFEGAGQTQALAMGWKVRAWVTDPGRVPVFNRPRCLWGLLLPDGSVRWLLRTEAHAAMREVYGAEWDRWADQLGSPLGLVGREI